MEIKRRRELCSRNALPQCARWQENYWNKKYVSVEQLIKELNKLQNESKDFECYIEIIERIERIKMKMSEQK